MRRLNVLQLPLLRQTLLVLIITIMSSAIGSILIGFTNFLFLASGQTADAVFAGIYGMTVVTFTSAALGLFLVFLIWDLIYFLYHSLKKVIRANLEKIAQEKEILELEAKALRAQMNPHFIFNSLNSIKSLINKNENDMAAGYLTTFSKLIRTLFQNSDKREVSLYEEIETCKLYAQLENMRFGNKIKFGFNIDENLDLKDIKVPALILQPFIENAIWHGLVPKETGGIITITLKQTDSGIVCIIDDDGIGRELSQQYKSQYEATHQSRGIGLTRSRLQLDKMLNERENIVEIIDKKDWQGRPLGTKVNLTFKNIKE